MAAMEKVLVFAGIAMIAAATVPAYLDRQLTSVEIPPTATGEADRRQVVSWRDAGGHHHFNASMNGTNVRVLVDTGATIVAIDRATARRIGIRERDHRGTMRLSTANGTVTAPRVSIRSIRLDGIEVRDVTAAVMENGQLGGALLGMSFLKRLKSFSFQGNKLTLVQ